MITKEAMVGEYATAYATYRGNRMQQALSALNEEVLALTQAHQRLRRLAGALIAIATESGDQEASSEAQSSFMKAKIGKLAEYRMLIQAKTRVIEEGTEAKLALETYLKDDSACFAELQLAIDGSQMPRGDDAAVRPDGPHSS